ncbi:MAG: sugar MFS transporter [Bacteroidaceae bacterium]|nr:sugar MFS transporter [Bacteroidaceae bacterium]
MKHRILLLGTIMCFWFTISFITNILGPLIPDIINNFGLKNLALAGFIPTSFFIAYAIMSVPAGLMIDRYGEKTVLIIGFMLPFLATLMFACIHSYTMLLISCFIIGLGMAMLQTVLNPLQRIVAGKENYAFIAELAQFIFGVASFLSPLFYSYLVQNLNTNNVAQTKNIFINLLSKITPPSLPWVSLYWVFALLLLIMIAASSLSKFPQITTDKEQEQEGKTSYSWLFKQKFVWLFSLGIFCYVATEQGTSIYMTTFLSQVYGVNPQTEGAHLVSFFWGSMTIGCIIGMILLKLIDSRKLLRYSGYITLILLGLSLCGSKTLAVICLPAMGFSISMMYSIIFSLALNSTKHHLGSFAGILCSAIVGGAVGPLLIGVIADFTNLHIAMLLIAIFVCYMIFIGFWAHPLVNNKTVSLKRLLTHK